ncbi:MAG TPA: OsmC family peroxiredoxin, partial [Thermoplasmatales archaeon]|nr:OsmC family peroxiredoxin [Thermoplasmatales archaeon]HEX08782.1 OsmC family peroxiredoxin [Thermoplasmatales archaeon]
MRVEIRQVEGLSFIGKGDTNHWVVIDGAREYFGSEAASRPMELLLIALGSCTASDVAAILNKKRVKLDGFKVVVEGERVEDYPKVFTKIHIDFIFYGRNLEKKHLERAIEL